MDKEAQEKIAKIVYSEGDITNEIFWESEKHKAHYYSLANQIFNLMEELGYRKPPKDKPPLLKPNNLKREWAVLLELVISSIKQGNRDSAEIALGSMAIIAFEAQKDADIKHYEANK